MTIRLAILGDTHVRSFDELPKEMIKEINLSDWVIHVGDYISPDVVKELIQIKKKKFKGVYGNADPNSVREKVRSKELFEISERKIGVTHPAFGGSSSDTEEIVLSQFLNEGVDLIIYGHTHEPKIEYKDNILLVNPGKGYLENNSFGPKTTMAILLIDNEIGGEIKEIHS
ncbi:MAG: metallophosphoesterase family protein [Promethearchaeota archaeon]|jgi:putative phosphoesterase